MESDYIIVGAGIIGYATAYELARNRCTVTLIDKNRVGLEASGAGGGILSALPPWIYAKPVTDLIGYSQQLYQEWTTQLNHESGVDPEYVRSGMIVLPPIDHSRMQDWAATHSSVREISSLQDFLPALQVAKNAVLISDVAQVRPPLLLQALQKCLPSKIRLLENTEAIGIETTDAEVIGIRTTQGMVRANRYIVTAGAWSPFFLGQAALGLSIKPIRGQMLLLKAPPGLIQHIVFKNGVYLIPRLDGEILIGSTIENVGFDKNITQEAAENLYGEACRMLPALQDSRIIAQWSGLRPSSPDNIPVISRHPYLKNLYINSGHFRYGITMAPASARILYQVLEEQPPTLDLAPYQWPTTIETPNPSIPNH